MATPVAALVPTITDLSLLQCYLTGKSLYAHLVTALPGLAVEVVAGCAIASGGNYTSLDLSNVEIRTAANGGVAVYADSITWLGLTTNGVPIAGVSFFVQQGFSKSTSDILFSTMAFVDNAQLLSQVTPDGTDLPVDLTTIPLFVTRSCT